jgi:hypothetical protein
MLYTSEYLNIKDNIKSSSEIRSAINLLESNILGLKQGGNMGIGVIDLKPLPRDFLEDWNIVNQKWNLLKTNLNKIIDPNDENRESEKSSSVNKETLSIETEALSLID